MNIKSPAHFRDAAPVLTAEQLSMSTMDLYQELDPPERGNLNDEKNHFGPFRDIRAQLDYSYHKLPNKSRQELQDSIVDVAIHVPNKCKTCPKKKLTKPIAMFTAGAMGAVRSWSVSLKVFEKQQGKSHSLKTLLDKSEIELPDDFIWVDPDRLSRKFPEREQYLKRNPESASSLLHPEASYLQEILAGYGRAHQRSLVIDGSLSDLKWFTEIMKKYRNLGYHIEIFFVFAEEKIMLERADQRAKETGRYTTKESIRRSAEKSPEAVEKLAMHEQIDRLRIIDNSRDGQDPKIIYDSNGDKAWQQGEAVDVKAIMHNRSDNKL